MIERAGPCRAEKRFQFGEGLFDRVEVRTVGRQKADVGACAFNRRANRRVFVDREAVEHDHIARAQRRDQDLVGVNDALAYREKIMKMVVSNVWE